MAYTTRRVRTLMAVIEATTGAPVDVHALAQALQGVAPEGIAVTAADIGRFAFAARQKWLMDAAAKLALRLHGAKKSPHQVGYEIYQARATAEGLQPYALKTYKNRAMAPWKFSRHE